MTVSSQHIAALALKEREGYIQRKAFSAFWLSIWTCALSHLSLCSLGKDKAWPRKDGGERG